MTPEQFNRACYDLELHSLPQDLQDAWREFALGTLKVLVEKWREYGYKYLTLDVESGCDAACLLASDAFNACSESSSGDAYDTDGNWHGCRCSCALVHALAASKRSDA
jgi:hypothetical protein